MWVRVQVYVRVQLRSNCQIQICELLLPCSGWTGTAPDRGPGPVWFDLELVKRRLITRNHQYSLEKEADATGHW